MKDKELLAEAYAKGYLNKSAMQKYIGYLRGEIMDLKPRIQATTAEGAGKEPRKKAHRGAFA